MEYSKNMSFNDEMKLAREEYERSIAKLDDMRKETEDAFVTRILQLKELSVRKELGAQVQRNQFKNEDDDTLLTMNEAAQFLNLSKSYIYQLVYQKKITAYKGHGRKLNFNLGELRKFKTGNWIGSAQQIADEYCRTHAIGGKKK